MSKKVCSWLNRDELSGLQIRDNGNLYPCAIRWIPLSDEPQKYKDYKNLRLEDIQDLRIKMFNEINEGKHKECLNCPLLHDSETENPIGAIKHLIYHPHTLCTLDCNYCFYSTEQKKLPIPEEYEDVYENIKHFYDIGLLNKEEFCLDLGGGEPTLLKNIDKTVEFMSKTWKNSTFCLLSNSTVTQKVDALIDSLKDKYSNVKKCLITSIDCGTAKTYEQIRSKDYYYQVLNNLSNYTKSNIFDEILLKYIFLDDMSNTNDDNIFGFLHICKHLDMLNKGVIKISFDIDWHSRKHNDDSIPDEILKVIGKMYYYATEILDMDYYFASDYLNQSTYNGKFALKKVLEYAKLYETQEKTERELYEIQTLKQNSYNKISPFKGNNSFSEDSVKDKLQICIITYNRKEYLERTLNQILDQKSPIRNFDITILDNASTDGTSELIRTYCEKYSNLKHIRHSVNIGGNANVIKAFELAKDSGKEYFWGLCDDDKYDFSNWSEVEEMIAQQKDIICVSNYAIHYNKNNEISLSDKLTQMTFFPAGIYKTDLLESNVFLNMTYSISDCFPHLCPTIHAINMGKDITILSKPIIFNGLHCEKSCKELSYTRGAVNTERAVRLEYSSWILGYANILNLLNVKRSEKKKLLISAILQDEVYGNWLTFYNDMFFRYFDKRKYNYLYEIFNLLPIKHTFKFLLRALNLKIHFCKESYRNKQDWVLYFEKRHFQNRIDKLARDLNGKRILLYGNGMISKILQEDYDLSKLNIVAVTDRKYLGCDNNAKDKYMTIAPNKLDMIDYDVVLIALKQSNLIKQSFLDKGSTKKIVRLIR